MNVECRWCGSDRTFGEACAACPCPLDVNEMIVARLDRLASAQPAAPAPERREKRRNSIAGILSGRAAARRLGIGRDTLARLEEVAVITSVPKGDRRGYRAVDVERLISTGYTLPGQAPRPAPVKRKRRRAPESADAASIAAELAKF